MSSSPRSTPTPARSRGALDDLLAAMDQDTPLAPRVRKRTYAESLGSGDENENSEGLFAIAPLLRGRNASEQIQRLGEAKRLRPEQIADAVASLNVCDLRFTSLRFLMRSPRILRPCKEPRSSSRCT